MNTTERQNWELQIANGNVTREQYEEAIADVAAELESDHNLGEHGPGAEQPECPTCKRYAKREAEMAGGA